MIIQCPFCFNKVILMQGSICPSCRKIVSQEDMKKEQCHSMAKISQFDKLPLICFLCGEKSTRFLKIRFSDKPMNKGNYYKRGFLIASYILIIIICIYLVVKYPQIFSFAYENGFGITTILGILVAYGPGAAIIFEFGIILLITTVIITIVELIKFFKRGFNISMPICNNCKEIHGVNPKYVDINKREITLVVHNKFKSEIES